MRYSCLGLVGNILFRFATGKGPWREMADTKEAKFTDDQKKLIAQLKMNEGKKPRIPERALGLNDPYIDLLLEAMEWCYQFKPEDRPTAREVATFLDKKTKEIDQQYLISKVEFGRLPK